MTFKFRLKALLALLLTGAIASFFFIQPLRADFFDTCDLCQSNYYLQQIARYTYYSLAAVNNIPAYMGSMAELANSLLKTDSSSATSTLQSDFTNYSNAILSNNQQQLNIQKTFLNDFFTQNGTVKMKLSPQTLPFANEVTYTTMLGQPFFPFPEMDEKGHPIDSALKYAENASGQAIIHVPPGTNWAGDDTSQLKYKNYYKTISAIQTFNSYVASELYVNKKNGFNLSNLQIKLMQDATNADSWFKIVASEEIGIVLRQLLLYESQIYVLIINLLQVQKDQLFAQTMTNSLLIMGNQFTENTLVQNAQGKTGV